MNAYFLRFCTKCGTPECQVCNEPMDRLAVCGVCSQDYRDKAVADKCCEKLIAPEMTTGRQPPKQTPSAKVRHNELYPIGAMPPHSDYIKGRRRFR